MAEEKKCPICGIKFWANKHAKVCSSSCRVKKHRQEKERGIMKAVAHIPDELADKAKLLVGHHNHRSFNDVLIKSLESYLRLNNKQLTKIEKEMKK